MKTSNANSELLGKRCEEVSQTLKALAHPDRLKLLCLLAVKERSVGQLVEECDCSQSQISQFLSRMKFEGLVDSARAGRQIRYRIADPDVKKLIQSIKRIYAPIERKPL